MSEGQGSSEQPMELLAGGNGTAKVAEVEADIEDWKTKREIHKLEKRADHAAAPSG